jgi:hypothetical protein
MAQNVTLIAATVVRLQEVEEEEKERGAAAVDRALQPQRRQYQFRKAEEVKGDGVKLTGAMLEA